MLPFESAAPLRLRVVGLMKRKRRRATLMSVSPLKRKGWLSSLSRFDVMVFYATSKMETPFLEWLRSNLKIKKEN